MFAMLVLQVILATPAQATQAARITTMARMLPMAGEPCAPTILDETSRHALRDDGSIVSWVNKLEADGVDVRVRAVDTAPGGSLDAYYAYQLQGCPDWSTDGTQVKPNMVVIMITMEHHSLVTSGNGSSLASVSADINGIRGVIKRPYDQGQYVQAITDALQRAYGDLHPGVNLDIVWIILIILGLVGFVVLACRYGGGSGTGGGGGYNSTVISTTTYSAPQSPPSTGGYSSGAC